MTDEKIIDRAAINRMLDLVGNDPDMFAGLLADFFEDAPRFIAGLHAALECGRADELRVAAHSFKSNSASFGALALAEECRSLEMLARAGSFEGAAEHIARIENEYSRAREGLEALVTILTSANGARHDMM